MTWFPSIRTEFATAELRGGVKMVTTGPETPPLLPDETLHGSCQNRETLRPSSSPPPKGALLVGSRMASVRKSVLQRNCGTSNQLKF